MSILPGGAALRAGYGTGLVLMNSKRSREAFADAVAGPKETRAATNTKKEKQ